VPLGLLLQAAAIGLHLASLLVELRMASLVKQLGFGGLVVRFADRKKPSFDAWTVACY
jgi:hypothetical protein